VQPVVLNSFVMYALRMGANSLYQVTLRIACVRLASFHYFDTLASLSCLSVVLCEQSVLHDRLSKLSDAGRLAAGLAAGIIMLGS
jgi:hypothetical protein